MITGVLVIMNIMMFIVGLLQSLMCTNQGNWTSKKGFGDVAASALGELHNAHNAL